MRCLTITVLHDRFSEMRIKLVKVSLSSSTTSYLFVSQCGRGLEGRRGAQAAERPGLADLWLFQGAATDGTEASQMGQVSGGADHAQRLAFYGLHGTIKGKKTSERVGIIRAMKDVFHTSACCRFTCGIVMTLYCNMCVC